MPALPLLDAPLKRLFGEVPREGPRRKVLQPPRHGCDIASPEAFGSGLIRSIEESSKPTATLSEECINFTPKLSS
jgi:hypothetical protein